MTMSYELAWLCGKRDAIIEMIWHLSKKNMRIKAKIAKLIEAEE